MDALREAVADPRTEPERVIDAIVDRLLDALGPVKEEESSPKGATPEEVRVCWRRDCPVPF